MPLLAPSPTKFLTSVYLSQSSWGSPGLAKVLQEAESPFVLRTGHCTLVLSLIVSKVTCKGIRFSMSNYHHVSTPMALFL